MQPMMEGRGWYLALPSVERREGLSSIYIDWRDTGQGSRQMREH